MEQYTFKSEYYQNKYKPIKNEIQKIKFVINLEPKRNDKFNSKENTIWLSLYTLEQFIRLYRFQNITNLLMRATFLMDDYISLIENKKKRKKRKDALIDFIYQQPFYDLSVIDGKAHIQWTIDYIIENPPECYEIDGMRIVFQHQMAYWHMARFDENVRKKFLNKAKSTLLKCIDIYSYKKIKEFLVSNKAAKDLWAKVICADFFACDMNIEKRNTPQAKKYIYFAIALYFTLLKIEEFRKVNGFKLDIHYPPAAIREMTVLHMLANEYGIPLEAYFQYIAGAWFFTSTFFDSIIQDIKDGI